MASSIPHRLERRSLIFEFFVNVQAAVALRGDEIVLIDDSVENVEAALTAGWQAFHWTKTTTPEILRSVCA